ncbi:MAG TPA: hypothetical protein VNM72_11420 [Blastocatellia bacterium]|nr:hypothetical protein [Blastocatellia bacterium]
MTCHQVRARFDPSDIASAEVTHHLARCADCRAYAEEMRRVYDLLAEWKHERVAVPEDFDDRLRHRLAEHRAIPSVRRILFAAPSMALAASLLVATVAGVIYFRISQQTPPQVSPRSSETATANIRPETGAQPSPSPAPSLPSLSESSPPSDTSPEETVAAADSLPRSRSSVAGHPRLAMESASTGVVLFIRDEETDEESIVPIPPVVFGSRPLFPLNVSTRLIREEKRGVL